MLFDPEYFRLRNSVAYHRKRLKLTQSQLADEVGISKNCLSNIEHGAGCSVSTAIRLSSALNVPIVLLFAFDFRDQKGDLPF